MPTPSGLTPQYGLPYLEQNDAPDIATASQSLAQAIENLVKQRIGTFGLCETTTPPTGAVLVQGQAVTRTGTYAALFAKWGTKFGAGNGTTTFNFPDFRGKGPVGYKSGTATFGALGASLGVKTVSLVTGNIPKFTLTVAIPNHTGTTGTESTPHDHDTPTDTAVRTTGSTLAVVPSASAPAGKVGISFGRQITGPELSSHHHTFTVSLSGTTSFGSASPTPVSVVQPSIVVNWFVWYK